MWIPYGSHGSGTCEWGAVAVLNMDIGPFYSEDWLSAGTTEFFAFRRENSLNAKLHEHRQSKVCSQQGKCLSRWNPSVFNVMARLGRSVPCCAAACAWAWEGQCLSVRLASERKRFSSLDLYLKLPSPGDIMLYDITQVVTDSMQYYKSDLMYQNMNNCFFWHIIRG